jgi:hypothetical protein
MVFAGLEGDKRRHIARICDIRSRHELVIHTYKITCELVMRRTIAVQEAGKRLEV